MGPGEATSSFQANLLTLSVGINLGQGEFAEPGHSRSKTIYNTIENNRNYIIRRDKRYLR